MTPLFLMQMPPTTLGIFALVMIILLIGFTFFVKRSEARAGALPAAPAATIDDYVAEHGEPEAVFVLDVTRSNELNAAVLVYEHDVVIEGRQVERDKITKVTFYNAQNPYLDSEYHLVLTTTLAEQPTIETTLGNDAQYAKDVVTQLAQQLKL